MDDLARKLQQLIVKAAGLTAVLGAYMMFLSRRARKQPPMLSLGSRIDVDISRILLRVLNFLTHHLSTMNIWKIALPIS
jgi:hypothetical protein